MGKRKNPKSKNPFHKPPDPGEPIEHIAYPVRLNKYIAKSGLCSRRKAVDLINEGVVHVNGDVEKLPYRLIEEVDVVTVKGKAIKPEVRLVYILLNKPKNTITTTDDENGRHTVMDLINWQGPERLFPVGRLDRNTTGLLLLTNDGDLTKKLLHPSFEVKKTYQVTLDKALKAEHFKRIMAGHTLPDGPVPVQDLQFTSEDSTTIVDISLSVGRNRIVRRLFESFGYEVVKLDRIYFAGLTKKNLGRGRHRHLTGREVIMLRHFV